MGADLSPSSEFEGKHEILINSHYYDVINWIPRHPGGNIIKFYTKQGEDASAAFDQFHGRCLNAAEKVLKHLPSREVAKKNGNCSLITIDKTRYEKMSRPSFYK